MTIQQILANIQNAVYGRDVRSSIHDGIELCYNERLPGGINPVQNVNEFMSGVALFTATAINLPSEAAYLIVAGGNSTNAVQVAYDVANNNPPQFRNRTNGSWGTWYRHQQ